MKITRRPEDWTRVAIRYYNYVWGKEISQFKEIPPHCLSIISCYSYKELARPLVRMYRRKGMKYGDIERLLNLSQKEVRTMGRKLGVYRVRS